jgi:outer membrane immunogenic protein
MRRMMFSLVALGVAQSALAADYPEPYLRGSEAYVPGNPVYYRWDGAYAGVQGGASAVHGQFPSNITPQLDSVSAGSPVSAAPLGQWLNLDNVDSTKYAASYGAFLGYNMQWENAVFGMEFSYNHTSTEISGTASTTRTFTNAVPTTYSVATSASSSVKLTDIATVRGRAGWVIDNWLPYGFVGLAIGRTQASQSASLSYTPNGGGGTVTAVSSNDDGGKFQYGWALGAGVDWSITPAIFLRAEYEYIQLNQADSINIRLSSVRAGLGVRF